MPTSSPHPKTSFAITIERMNPLDDARVSPPEPSYSTAASQLQVQKSHYNGQYT